MRSSLLYGIAAALITAIVMWLDDRLLDAKKTKAIYFKNMLYVGLLVGGGIYLIGEEAFDSAIGVVANQTGRGGYGFIGGFGEEMFTGSPDF